MARPADAGTIVAILNATGDSDSTYEAEVLSLLAAPGAMFLLRVYRGEVVGCAFLKKMGNAAYMGMLAVRPSVQGGGVDNEIIAEAERVAREDLHCNLITVGVLTRRLVQHHPY